MSQENVEIGQRMIAALNRRDLDAALSLVADDVTWATLISTDTKLIKGKSQLREEWENQIDLLDPTWEAEDLTDLGEDTVLGTVRIAGRGAAGGVPVEASTALVAVFRDRRVAEVRTYSSRAEALEAVGLSE